MYYDKGDSKYRNPESNWGHSWHEFGLSEGHKDGSSAVISSHPLLHLLPYNIYGIYDNVYDNIYGSMSLHYKHIANVCQSELIW